MAEPSPDGPSRPSLVRLLLEHVQARCQLLAVEAGEAGQQVGVAVAWFAVAAILAVTALLLLSGAISAFLADLLGIPWYFVAAALAGLACIVAVIAVAAGVRRLRHPYFADSLAELQKDRGLLEEDPSP